MAYIKTILVDDSGQEYAVRSYDLGTGLTGLDAIETSLESQRSKLFGDLTNDLLSIEQEENSEKKTDVGILT